MSTSFDRMTVDEQPFGQTGTAGATVGRLVGGEHIGRMVEGDTANALRRRTEHWARARGFVIADSTITHTVDGVTAIVPLYAITEGTAVVRGTAAQPVNVSLVIEPKTWTHRLRARFGGKAFETGEEAFDRAWHIDASDAGAAHHMINEECRETVRDAACWCRAVYERGAIEVRLDAERMSAPTSSRGSSWSSCWPARDRRPRRTDSHSIVERGTLGPRWPSASRVRAVSRSRLGAGRRASHSWMPPSASSRRRHAAR